MCVFSPEPSIGLFQTDSLTPADLSVTLVQQNNLHLKAFAAHYKSMKSKVNVFKAKIIILP